MIFWPYNSTRFLWSSDIIMLLDYPGHSDIIVLLYYPGRSHIIMLLYYPWSSDIIMLLDYSWSSDIMLLDYPGHSHNIMLLDYPQSSDIVPCQSLIDFISNIFSVQLLGTRLNAKMALSSPVPRWSSMSYRRHLNQLADHSSSHIDQKTEQVRHYYPHGLSRLKASIVTLGIIISDNTVSKIQTHLSTNRHHKNNTKHLDIKKN